MVDDPLKVSLVAPPDNKKPPATAPREGVRVLAGGQVDVEKPTPLFYFDTQPHRGPFVSWLTGMPHAYRRNVTGVTLPTLTGGGTATIREVPQRVIDLQRELRTISKRQNTALFNAKQSGAYAGDGLSADGLISRKGLQDDLIYNIVNDPQALAERARINAEIDRHLGGNARGRMGGFGALLGFALGCIAIATPIGLFGLAIAAVAGGVGLFIGRGAGRGMEQRNARQIRADLDAMPPGVGLSPADQAELANSTGPATYQDMEKRTENLAYKLAGSTPGTGTPPAPEHWEQARRTVQGWSDKQDFVSGQNVSYKQDDAPGFNTAPIKTPNPNTGRPVTVAGAGTFSGSPGGRGTP